jgi:hypothetical protein
MGVHFENHFQRFIIFAENKDLFAPDDTSGKILEHVFYELPVKEEHQRRVDAENQEYEPGYREFAVKEKAQKSKENAGDHRAQGSYYFIKRFYEKYLIEVILEKYEQPKWYDKIQRMLVKRP